MAVQLSTVLFCIVCLTVAQGTYWGYYYNCHDVKKERCINSGTAKLECSENEFINVTTASYSGRIWRGWRPLRCFDPNAKQKVQDLCNGKQTCEFICSDDIFNETTHTDCRWEKLKVQYKCDTDPCTTFCCSNGGTCELTSDMTPVCVCNGSWTGTNCDDNPCNSMMCQNNGTCLVNPADGSVQCGCTEDYTGTTCEIELPCNETQFYENPCDSLMCENNGSCLVNPANNTAQCCCTSDYTGETCQTQLDACSKVECQNGGSCIVSITGLAVCLCPTGFVGTFCQDDCSITPPCPDGYQELPAGSGNCYFICTFEAESWLAAEAFCRLNGSVLWQPNNQAEVDAVKAELLGSKTYWIGAFDGLSEGTTIYTASGAPFTLATAGTNTKTKDCLNFEIESPSTDFEFRYRECTSSTKRCICERQDPCNNPVPVVPVPPIPPIFASP